MGIYFIAGEASGDYIGGKILSQLKEMKPNIKIHGIGGSNMQEQGLKSLFPMSHLSVMGFIEIIPKIFKFLKLIEQTIDDIINKNPELLITIDSPGFNERVARGVKKRNPKIKLLHIVAPSVWAYKASRAKKYAGIFDHLLTLLPFEPPYFQKHGLATTYIGHPILEQNFPRLSADDIQHMRSKFGIKIAPESKVIAITPGSRAGEIEKHMSILVDSLNIVAASYDFTALIVQVNENHIKRINAHLVLSKFKYKIVTEKLEAFAVSDLAIAKSGTNTLEIAACRTPQIVFYKVNFISYLIIRALFKAKFVSLINIVAGKEIIPEYIQHEFNKDNIAGSVIDYFIDNLRGKSQVKSALTSLEKMGFSEDHKNIPSKVAAEKIINIINH